MELQKHDALLIIDVQKDFCPGGALAVPEGDTVIAPLNIWIDQAKRSGAPVYVEKMQKKGVELVTTGTPAFDHVRGKYEFDPEELPVCTKAPEWAEHHRMDEADEPCEDGRGGRILGSGTDQDSR